ncbi:TATD2-like protein [Mya arenaria]|uniref:TATD2-like protein n=1 Tax=Mya arenaria TaxID=6604 RepID=A0ABY7FZ75_MYAAR|nr:TATD2-like protein [Mya arenaria]
MNSYPTQLEVDRLRQQGVVVAVGINPKHAAELTEKDWSAFEAALALSGVSALGEVGLDYTSQSSTWGIQHAVLHRALGYLRPDRVLVLHNRRNNRNAGDDMLQLLFQLKGCIPTEQRIHLHCFAGSQYAVDQWTSHFSNIHFGYTAAFLNARENAIQALRNIDESRFLLETDSPYFGNDGNVWTKGSQLFWRNHFYSKARSKITPKTTEKRKRNVVTPTGKTPIQAVKMKNSCDKKQMVVLTRRSCKRLAQRLYITPPIASVAEELASCLLPTTTDASTQTTLTLPVNSDWADGHEHSDWVLFEPKKELKVFPMF